MTPEERRPETTLFRPQFIDTHAHLDDPGFADDLQACLERAGAAGVVAIITVGTDLASSEWAVAHAGGNPRVYAAVGVHPHEAGSVTAADFARLAELTKHPKVVAVGETGLDFYRNLAPRAVAEEVFREHLKLAAEAGLPVIVHARQAHETALDVLASVSPAPAAVLHSFDGSLETARRATAMGLCISFTGVLTFRNAEALRAVAGEVPLDRVMVETDCPYLAPQRYRGMRNEPAYVSEVAGTLAQLHGLHVRDVARMTMQNARRFFRLGGIDGPGVIAYPLGDSLYLNITNQCTNACSFCIRFQTDYIGGHCLKLDHEPGVDEVLSALGGEGAAGELAQFQEVVFCGYGEPTCRLDVLKRVGRFLKDLGVQVRLDTNGTGSLQHGRNIVPELAKVVDEISISLNAASADEYTSLCRPRWGVETFPSVIDFIKKAKECFGRVTVTAVSCPGVHVEAVRHLARGLGVEFRLRRHVSHTDTDGTV